MMEIRIFNPFCANSAENAAQELLRQKPAPLANMEPFLGSGIFAIYYAGDFEAYAHLRHEDACLSQPLYVGAGAPGPRKSVFGLDLVPPPALYGSLMDCADSIESAHNLAIDDFWCKFLVLEEEMIAPTRTFLANRLLPLWNTVLEGIEINPGVRKALPAMRSRWDTVHPGRAWADKCIARPETPEQICAEITAARN